VPLGDPFVVGEEGVGGAALAAEPDHAGHERLDGVHVAPPRRERGRGGADGRPADEAQAAVLPLDRLVAADPRLRRAGPAVADGENAVRGEHQRLAWPRLADGDDLFVGRPVGNGRIGAERLEPHGRHRGAEEHGGGWPRPGAGGDGEDEGEQKEAHGSRVEGAGARGRPAGKYGTTRARRSVGERLRRYLSATTTPPTSMPAWRGPRSATRWR